MVKIIKEVKHMARTNYNKMSNRQKDDIKREYENVSVEITENEPVIEDTAVEKVVEAPVKKGVVVGCAKLNIRKAPKATAEIVGTLTAGTTVIIHDEIGDFYKIGNPDLGEYCMKKFISVK
jgi:hypothetical protein